MYYCVGCIYSEIISNCLKTLRFLLTLTAAHAGSLGRVHGQHRRSRRAQRRIILLAPENSDLPVGPLSLPYSSMSVSFTSYYRWWSTDFGGHRRPHCRRMCSCGWTHRHRLGLAVVQNGDKVSDGLCGCILELKMLGSCPLYSYSSVLNTCMRCIWYKMGSSCEVPAMWIRAPMYVVLLFWMRLRTYYMFRQCYCTYLI